MDTKKLRQKILDLAIRGKLVPQDPNDEPASVLLERIKAEKERLIKEGKIKRSKKTTKTSDTPHYENVPFEVPKGWVWTDIENICSKIGSGSTPRGSNYSSKGIPFFRSQNIYNNGLVYEDIKFISEEVHQTMIGTEVLPNEEGYLQENSVRAPRNEVARFILSDLDDAIERLNDAGFQNNQRINKQTAQLFKSRVALFEGTFEKYHQGTGRVPGDSNWPGGTFEGNIQDEINFFFDQAMAAASAVADYSGLTLTENSHVINPEYGEIYGWNPYFEMLSQPSLSSVPEVLFWKEYNKSLSISHDAPNRLKVGDNDGITRSFITSFLMKDGLPFYASSNYQGDETLDKEFANRDERLQLFVWAESTVLKTDPTEQGIAESGEVELFEKPLITNSATQNLDRTGYRQRKHYTYDYTQSTTDELLGTNACPIFRVAEAYLNYIEACYERTGQIDTKADGYWRALRRRADLKTQLLVTALAVFFTALFTLLDDALTPLFYGYTKEAALAYFAASLPTMAMQCVCALLTVFLLFRPLMAVLRRVRL